MPDQIFENSRLASIYDDFDGQREDLQNYLKIVKEFGAKSILDIGCGTGCFAVLLKEQGYDVTGLDPARASLEIARRKRHADKIQWILGDATCLPPMTVDLAVMTGNVAQVFITDESWEENLLAIRKVLQPQGHLVFEVRDPERQAWLAWTPEKTHQRLEIKGIGYVEGWCEVKEVSEELVTFCWTYTFESDGKVLSSDSTLRFRKREDIIESLDNAGYSVLDIRDAPDRPGKEFVFIAQPKS